MKRSAHGVDLSISSNASTYTHAHALHNACLHAWLAGDALVDCHSPSDVHCSYIRSSID
jgi:hypothetical protein